MSDTYTGTFDYTSPSLSDGNGYPPYTVSISGTLTFTPSDSSDDGTLSINATYTLTFADGVSVSGTDSTSQATGLVDSFEANLGFISYGGSGPLGQAEFANLGVYSVNGTTNSSNSQITLSLLLQDANAVAFPVTLTSTASSPPALTVPQAQLLLLVADSAYSPPKFQTQSTPYGDINVYLPQPIQTTDASGNPITLTPVAYLMDPSGTQALVAYQAPTGNIIIGIEGTSSLWELLTTDLATWSVGPSAQFLTYLSEVSAFIEKIENSYPNAQIALAGHSLGGAEAQILGYFYNLPATAFQGPGVANLITSSSVQALVANYAANMPSVTSVPGGYNPANTPPISIDVSTAGDIVHRVGEPFGTQETIYLANPIPGTGLGGDSSYNVFTNHDHTNVENELSTPGTTIQLGAPPESDPVLSENFTISTGVQANTATSDFNYTIGPNESSIVVPAVGGMISPGSERIKGLERIAGVSESAVSSPPSGAQFVYTVGSGSVPIADVYFTGDGQAIASFIVSTESGGAWTAPVTYAAGTPVPLPSDIQAFAFEAVDSGGNVLTLPAGYSFIDTFTGAGTVSGTLTVVASPAVITPLNAAFTNVLRGAPNSSFATSPTITLANGSTVPNPMYQDAQSLPALESQVATGQITLAQALNTIEHDGDTTASVATIAYEFFTGATPNSGGYDYLINSTTNPNDLNDAYYAQFNAQNRYINFAVNLGEYGAGATDFNAAYGSLDLTDAMTKAYTTIFGFTPAAGKIAAILDAVVGPNNETRAEYFAYYGGDGADGIGTKAAAIGWLMTVAVQADLGVYAAANDAFLAALANGNAEYNIDLLTAYPTMTAAQAAAIETYGVSSIAHALTVADTGADVVANLDALQALAAGNELTSITLTDAATPTLTITATQLVSDAQALSDISNTFVLQATGATAQFSGATVVNLTTQGSGIDLTDLSYNALNATFVENGAGTGGQLTLSDGVHAVTVGLVGQLAPAGFSGSAASAGFVFIGDGNSGTWVTWH